MANGQQTDGTGSYPITRIFAGLVLAALAYLILTRHLFGVIRVEAGTR